MTIPLYFLGFALRSNIYDKHYLEKLVPSGNARKALKQDNEIVVGAMKAFHRIVENEEEKMMLREQFATFHIKRNIFTQVNVVTKDRIDL